MYEERNDRFSFRDVILQLLFVVLFIFILLWLFPTKGYLDKKLNGVNVDLQPLYERFFNENILTMKDAAKSYFTDPRLPKNVGDKVTKTLREMQKLNLILPFTDSNGQQCDLDDSYVEITKMDDEYIMKVNLSCSDKEAYIIEHMGCYTYCETAICEKEEPVTTPTETPSEKPIVTPTITKKYKYQYMKATDCTLGNWSSWSEWTTHKATSNDYIQVETKTEKELSHYEQVWGVVKTQVQAVKSYVDKEVTTYVDKEVTTYVDKEVTNYVDKEVTTYVEKEVTTYETKQVQTGTKKVAVGTKTETAAYITTTTPTSYSWVSAGSVTTSSIPTNTSTTRYSNCKASVRKELSCTSTCTTVNIYTYTCSVSKLKQTGGTTTKTCPSGYSNTGSGCSKQVTIYQETPIYETQRVPVTTIQKVPLTTTQKVPVTTIVQEAVTTTVKEPVTKTVKVETITYEPVEIYGWINGDPVYKNVTYYRTRTRSCTGGSVDYKWSNSQNDQTLIKQGYTLTGNVQEI